MTEQENDKWLRICQLGALIVVAVYLILIIGEPDLLDALINRIMPSN